MIYAIANRKGGTGKTTTALNLGAYLARAREKVLLIDLDAQGNLTTDAGGEGRTPTVLEVLTGTAAAREAVAEIARNLALIPSNPNLITADIAITDARALSRALEPIGGEYTHIIIDTPPTGGILIALALTAADAVIIPTEAERKGFNGVAAIARNIQAVKQATNPALTVAGILITRYSGRAIISRQMAAFAEILAAQMGTKVFKARIRECTALKEAAARNADIFSYALKSNAARDYSDFGKELTE